MDDFWSLNEGTFYCLFDNRRTSAFRKAINDTVKKGDVVVELGAGSGVLSIFAADAGAKKVYAVELDQANVNSLQATLKQNGYDDRIEVIQEDALSVQIPEKVDVIICEMIATGLIEELQVPAMNHVLKFAKKNCSVILEKYHTYAELVNQRNTYFGKDFQVFRYEFPDKPSLRSNVLSDAKLLNSTDFRTPVKKTRVNFSDKFKVTKPGVINGVRIKTLTEFSNGQTFDHSISYSFPIILPIEDIPVSKGDTFQLDISYTLCGGPAKLKYKISACR